MEETTIEAIKLAGGQAATDMSLWGLFMHADLVGKSVIFGLLIISVITWAVIFDKWMRMSRLNRRATYFEDRFWSGASLEQMYEKISKRPNDPMQAVFVAGMKEWRSAAEKGLLATHNGRNNLLSRIDRVMQVTIGREMTQIESWMTFLASVGSVAPFIGLFGTVWGIMRSFIGIAAAQNTSLAVVAPGIAEALLATAIGLVAAIPATAAYNKFASDLGKYNERLDNFAADFSSLLSRNLEEQKLVA
ncbi:MAG: protein TolQ [Alphaproteobacteria bacterium]|nr:protein TolQ [Alphaproteobacteria bacterium]NDC56650.1 protein TolQ [Alphaproteobacteria bacterium]NDG04246.1 protein TolQ [Alphaproteobacteria bacterium]